MSLDVYLYTIDGERECRCYECGHVHKTVNRIVLYTANITHNLIKMARAAGIYRHLWRPDEICVKNAGELIGPIEKGLALMKDNPERFREFNPKNGWGSYDDFVPWIEEYLKACKAHPEALIEVSR